MGSPDASWAYHQPPGAGVSTGTDIERIGFYRAANTGMGGSGVLRIQIPTEVRDLAQVVFGFAQDLHEYAPQSVIPDGQIDLKAVDVDLLPNDPLRARRFLPPAASILDVPRLDELSHFLTVLRGITDVEYPMGWDHVVHVNTPSPDNPDRSVAITLDLDLTVLSESERMRKVQTRLVDSGRDIDDDIRVANQLFNLGIALIARFRGADIFGQAAIEAGPIILDSVRMDDLAFPDIAADRLGVNPSPLARSKPANLRL